MRVAYFINTFNLINWGGQATSTGLKLLVETTYPKAKFVPLDIPSLPFKHYPFLQNIYNRKLAQAILDDNVAKVGKYLIRLGIPLSTFEGFDAVCFNGEGAIHSKSGHLIRLMGMLYYFKYKGTPVSALNQTVDVKDNLQGQEVLAKVYSMLDYVAAREPVSERELVSLGIDAKLIPDAAYALPRLSAEQIELHTKNMNLPPKFIGVTGSSALKKSSVDMMGFVLKLIKEHYRLPIVFLANAKTDIALAKALKDKYGLLVVQPPVKYQQAMAVIAKAHLVIGGRQHPNIFAAMHHVPFIPFAGNTHKMNGVIELLGYPTQVIPWEKNRKRILKAFTTTDQLYDNLCRIEAPQPIRVQLVPRL